MVDKGCRSPVCDVVLNVPLLDPLGPPRGFRRQALLRIFHGLEPRVGLADLPAGSSVGGFRFGLGHAGLRERTTCLPNTRCAFRAALGATRQVAGAHDPRRPFDSGCRVGILELRQDRLPGLARRPPPRELLLCAGKPDAGLGEPLGPPTPQRFEQARFGMAILHPSTRLAPSGPRRARIPSMRVPKKTEPEDVHLGNRHGGQPTASSRSRQRSGAAAVRDHP